MSGKKSHLLLARAGYSQLLAEEMRDRWQRAGTVTNDAAVAFEERVNLPKCAETIFARQVLPMATAFPGADTNAAVHGIVERLEIMTQRANRQTGRWTLHSFALDDDPGTQRAAKVEKALLSGVKEKLSRLHKRYVAPDEIAEAPAPEDLIVQVYAAGTESLWLSAATIGNGVSPYIGGNLRMRERAGAPSRSARKLDEAFLEMDRTPREDETAVDLGAAPGGWTFSLARHGVRVSAIDHADLSLPETKKFAERVEHLRENGVKYMPSAPVDWLCSDMLIGSQEALRVLGGWFKAALMKNFVVNVKLPQTEPWPAIKDALALLEAQKGWHMLKAKHLYHDRREITLMGRLTKD